MPKGLSELYLCEGPEPPVGECVSQPCKNADGAAFGLGGCPGAVKVGFHCVMKNKTWSDLAVMMRQFLLQLDIMKRGDAFGPELCQLDIGESFYFFKFLRVFIPGGQHENRKALPDKFFQ